MLRATRSKVAVPERQDLLWQFDRTFCNLRYKTEKAERPLSATFRGVRLGELDVYKYQGRGFRGACRNPQHIRGDLVDNFIFALLLNGAMEVSQSGHKALIEPGIGVFLATKKPFEVACDEQGGSAYEELVIQIPGPILRRHVPFIDDYCASSIEMNQGAGKVTSSLIQALVDEGSSLSNNQAIRYGSAMLNIIIGMMPNEQEYLAKLESPRTIAYARVRECAAQFIERNLSNVELDANLVAAHCHVSIRYLFAAFEESSSSVGTQIRELRLQRSRAELMNPSLAHHSVTRIAMRWGFSSSSAFSRSYVARFGKTPSEDRVSARI